MKPQNSAPVTKGRVKITALKLATARKAKFCTQILRRDFGQTLPRVKGERPLRSIREPRRCAHSPIAGMGHMVHQARAPTGMSSMMSRAHQTIHTKMMEKLALPTGGPKRAG